MLRLSQKSLNFAISQSLSLKMPRMLSSLVKNQALINGQWTKASDNKQFGVINPANMEVIAQVPDMNKADCQRAIDAAHDAFYSKEWHSATAKERSGLLKVSKNVVPQFSATKFKLFRTGSVCSKRTSKELPKL